MGGNALKKVKTVRKTIPEYNKIKNKIQIIFNKQNIKIHFILNLNDKNDHGDLDILWSNQDNSEINMYEFIKNNFIPNEIVVNGPVISFDFDNFQIDIIKVSNIKFAQFYFSYGDFGHLIGSMVKKYKLTFGHNGFFINYDNQNILLTNEVDKCCTFIDIDINQWKSIKTKIELFELIKSCKFYNQECFKHNNYLHRKKIIHRPLYIEFLEYIGIVDQKSIIELETDYSNKIKLKIDKTSIFDEAILYFNKQNEIDTIIKHNKKYNIIKSKFNANLIKERGYTDDKIGIIIKAFKNKYSNFDDWVYDTTIKEINESLDNLILDMNI